jgi:hypothetical protein
LTPAPHHRSRGPQGRTGGPPARRRFSLRAADCGWIALALGVVAYEAAATQRRHDWELLSEACDRYRIGHPILTNLTIAYLAAHLTRLIPRQLDPLYIIGTRATAWRAQ